MNKRAFTSARHAQRRDLFKACNAAAKGTEWKARQGVIVGERGGWLIAAHEMTDVLRERTRVRLVTKPMAIDPILWDLVGEPQLRRQGLTFRYFGAVTCPCLILEEPEVSEEGGVDAIASRMIALADAKLTEITGSWTADTFLQGIRNAINPGRHFASTVATLIAERRYDDALELLDEAVARSAPGGFVSRRGSFPENAAKWIRDNMTVENR